jgi:hypothetical protein
MGKTGLARKEQFAMGGRVGRRTGIPEPNRGSGRRFELGHGTLEPPVGGPPKQNCAEQEIAPSEMLGPVGHVSENSSCLALPKTKAQRDKEHLAFVAAQPCLVCGRSPTDPHHLRFAEPRAFGRKASDESTVPLCRAHHCELHGRGDELTCQSSTGCRPGFGHSLGAKDSLKIA